MELLSFPPVVRHHTTKEHRFSRSPIRSSTTTTSYSSTSPSPSPSLLKLESQQLTRLEDLASELQLFLKEAVPKDGGRRLRKQEILTFLARIQTDKAKLQELTPAALRLMAEGRPYLKMRLEAALEDLEIAMGIYEKMVADASGEEGRVGLPLFESSGSLGTMGSKGSAIVLVPSTSSTSPTELVQVVETGPDRLMLSHSTQCHQSLTEEPLANSPTLILGPDKHCPRCGSPLAILTPYRASTSSWFGDVSSSGVVLN